MADVSDTASKSEEILRAIMETAAACDDAAVNLARCLAKHREAIERLKPLMGDTTRHLLGKRDVVTGLGVGGLREFVTLPGEARNDSLSFVDHVHLFIAGLVRNAAYSELKGVRHG